MTDKFIVKSKAGLIHDAVAGEDDRIIECSTFSEPTSPQGLNFLEKAKCAGFRNLILKCTDRAIVVIRLCLDQRVIIVNRIGNAGVGDGSIRTRFVPSVISTGAMILRNDCFRSCDTIPAD